MDTFADARKVHVQAAAEEHFNDDDADDVSLPGLDEDDSDDKVPVDTDSSDRAAAHRGSLHNHMIIILSRGDAKPQQEAFEVLEMDHVD